MNREEFEAFKKQQHDLFDRLAALERSINDLRSQPTIVSDEKIYSTSLLLIFTLFHIQIFSSIEKKIIMKIAIKYNSYREIAA